MLSIRRQSTGLPATISLVERRRGCAAHRRAVQRADSYAAVDHSSDMMCALTKMNSAFTQHTSQIVPPATPAERNRTWSASLPQNAHRRSLDGLVDGLVILHTVDLLFAWPPDRKVRSTLAHGQ